MKIRSTSLAMAAMMSAGFLAAPINVLAKAPEMPQGIYAQPFAEGEQAAAKEKHYDLKWKLKMADGSGKDSMAQDYIEKVTAVEKDGKWTFTISTKPESSQLIAKFYYYKDGTKFEAQQNGNDWSFTLDSKPENPIKLAFAITVMQGKEKEAFLEISDYKGIKGEASQEPETPGQNPKEDTPLEKAKKALEDAIEKANDADRDKLDVKVVNALNDSTESAGALLKEASAKEDDLALKVSELNFLLALGEKTRGMDDTAKKAYKGFLTVASELKDAKLADKGSLKKNLDENAKLLKAADKKEEDLKKAGDAFALFMGNSKAADDTDIGHLKELVEKKKKVDSSSYTEESQKKLKDLLATAEKEIEAGKLTKGRVWELETAINSWHGELKAPEKPKEDKKDDKKDEKKKDQTVRYDVPVELVQSDGRESMASSALSSWATVDAYRGAYTYYIQFKPMKFGDKEGRLTNLFYYENGRKYRARYHGGDLWSFTLDERVSSQKIAVWVDIMDEIAGGAGKGEKEAYIQFNWYRAKETKRFDGQVKEPEKKKEDEKKEEEKKKLDEKALEEKKKEFLKAQRERERQVVLRAFSDMSANHWALDAIAHSYARGYFKGEGEGRFAPERAITRGEFVTILGRKAGAAASNTATIYQDVSSGAYYAGYVAWAQSKGIVAGVGQGRFEPNRTITREEMAVMLNKFLASQNKSYAATGYGNFSDGGSIAGWAKDSVDKMTRQGLLSGMGNGNFAPKESFSRAQAAQVLYTIDTKDMK
ncbi:S-layer homology domain-containing protein [Aedoeadaptatus pacaensis]|uniref:S-layer homology domain-containing protein n=1 Tax=Aedoeadaptatus pacaensis TaxID=1776390 RepID=UPI00083974CE|nr:S-layer homology domain-containing protein [Peptoniphilus pacaensis]